MTREMRADAAIDLFARGLLRNEAARDLWQPRYPGRVVALVRDADEGVAEPELAENFRGAREERDDPHEARSRLGPPTSRNLPNRVISA